MHFTVTDTGVETDFPYGNLQISGDEEKGYRPFQLMIASIASCSGFVYKRILEKQRMKIDSIEIKAEVERNEKEANRIEKISLAFIVEGEELDLKKLENALTIARNNCGMVRSVEDAITIVETVTIK